MSEKRKVVIYYEITKNSPWAWAINKGTLPIIGVTKVKHVLYAKEAVNIILADDEIKYLEDTADKLGVSTIRYWEKEMK